MGQWGQVRNFHSQRAVDTTRACECRKVPSRPQQAGPSAGPPPSSDRHERQRGRAGSGDGRVGGSGGLLGGAPLHQGRVDAGSATALLKKSGRTC
jgi:hypothetical protein